MLRASLFEIYKFYGIILSEYFWLLISGACRRINGKTVEAGAGLERARNTLRDIERFFACEIWDSLGLLIEGYCRPLFSNKIKWWLLLYILICHLIMHCIERKNLSGSDGIFWLCNLLFVQENSLFALRQEPSIRFFNILEMEA